MAKYESGGTSKDDVISLIDRSYLSQAYITQYFDPSYYKKHGFMNYIIESNFDIAFSSLNWFK